MTIDQVLTQLHEEKINTWFDLGLFIDKFKEDRKIPNKEFNGSFGSFRSKIGKGGLAFITYQYAVDGVTIEIEKYAKIFQSFLHEVPIHLITGEVYPEAKKIIKRSYHLHELKELRGFDDWPLYKDFYFTKLERGGSTYNRLIHQFWQEVLVIIEKLGNYLEFHRIELLYPVNVNSNPGNVSLSLALVLISEYLGIPVINNNHDFYWESGNSEANRESKNLKKGPRDFFFRNAHLGEFFSQIEVLFPWESRTWINVNINLSQSQHLIEQNGHNPANVTEINTAVDTSEFTNVTKRMNIKSFMHTEAMLARYKKHLPVYTAHDILTSQLVTLSKNDPILIGAKKQNNLNFVGDNIVFLQPTRVMVRKRIEIGFDLITRLLDCEHFKDKFLSNKRLKITLLVTGPIPLGQFGYFQKLIDIFSGWLKSLSPDFRKRVYLGFLFSEFDKASFRKRISDPLGIPELYNIASLILLPSETEGRGLPIIEAAACGIPVFCRRYYPENVYAEVIGEHLDERDRLKVLEFEGVNIPNKLVDNITDRIFFSQNHLLEVEHNQKVVQKRFSLESLKLNIEEILVRLYLQRRSNQASMELVAKEFKLYKNSFSTENKYLKEILHTQNRQYLAGNGRIGFMIYLKSLIDPSFFRVEEQKNKGAAMIFAKKLVEESKENRPIDIKKTIAFYNAVDNIFNYHTGSIIIRHDHSLGYRHRNKNYYPYHDYTPQELTGLINLLFHKIIQPPAFPVFRRSPHFFTDWNLALFQMTNSSSLPIDDRKRLVKKLHNKYLPFGYFPGEFFNYELEYLILQPVRARLNLKIEEELTPALIKEKKREISSIYVFCQEHPLDKWVTYDFILQYLSTNDDNEIRTLFRSGILKLVKTQQWTVGLHARQLGEDAWKTLSQIKKAGGFIITNGDNSASMTDVLNVDRFHIGKAEDEMVANIMGIPLHTGFIQFVPAGIRTTLAYPTPVQTAKDFHDTLKSTVFKKLSRKLGEQKLFVELQRDAETKGTPIKVILENIQTRLKKKNKIKPVAFEFVTGVYKDELPFSGILAKASIKHPPQGFKWKFAAFTSNGDTMKVTDFVEKFETKRLKKAQIAWNGGYILNPELVGKLGIPESYIGSPLGLIISKGKVLAPPLFNKPSLVIFSNGKLDIQKINCQDGLIISDNKSEISFTHQNYNLKKPEKAPCFYDLMYGPEEIVATNRIIVRLAGNKIKEVIQSGSKKMKILPVGLTLSIPPELFPKNWDEVDKELNIQMIGSQKIEHAIEAGPMLVDKGRVCIDMEDEGWKTNNSIRTQAARLDFTDMRGPKIAAGFDHQGNLLVLTINGRIRESVGATHHDMAEILIQNKVQKGMGFDPGGSSTLVVGKSPLNISPYNPDYEKNIYSLPPVPRAVSNAVIGWLE